MKRYFGYIRVSTTKQGEQGSSLQEQRAAIEAYAARNNLKILEWFEEQETAASQGRPIFGRMLKAIERGSASGVITHKIDRSARNLKDWAHIGDLIDRGVEMHFAHESLDLMSRSGRLSADILAVVASDYIRNLRDEVRKGFYGRLKQGLYPIRAPIGYLDQGRGKPKTIDPVRGPLVRLAFELYATGRWSIETLGEELYQRGLRNRRGNRLTRNGVSTMLNHPFYTGTIRIRKTGEVFAGIHEPLVRRPVFDAVQAVLEGRTPHRTRGYSYRYQRLIRCASCGYSLIAERQKGRVYYRCHTSDCPTTCAREDEVNQAVTAALRSLALEHVQWDTVRADIDRLFDDLLNDMAKYRKNTELALASLDDRIATLTDAVLDGLIDRAEYQQRKERLLGEQQSLMGRKNDAYGAIQEQRAQAEEILELAKSLHSLADLANEHEVRGLMKSTTSNFVLREKCVELTWREPFCRFTVDAGVTCGAPYRALPRTEIIAEIVMEYATRKKADHAKELVH